MQHHTPSRLSREEELSLLDSMIAGDDHAWHRFHVLYSRLIHRCIRNVTHRFSRLLRAEDEHEIYANLNVQLLSKNKEKLRRFDPERGSRLSTWIGLLATNAAYDYLRAIRREVPRAPLSDATDALSRDPSPYDEVERRQHSQLMNELMTQLTTKDQQFVHLYFRRGMSAAAVARAMNISVNTVYSKKHKIQSRLDELVASTAA